MKKHTGVCVLKFIEERKKEQAKKDEIKLLQEILDRNYIFTDHIFKASEIEIIRKK